jgi:hypothetical protein
MTTYPIVFIWRKVEIVDIDGVALKQLAMVPLPRYQNVAKRQFGEGGEYTLEQVAERSMASHNAYFAAINEGFKNLPEKIAARWPSPTHMRKWILCETNWFDEKEFDLTSEKQAKALATFIRTEDEYARIALRGTKVVVRKARSQSFAAMGKADFEASKRDVLDLLESMVDVPKGTLMREAGMSA